MEGPKDKYEASIPTEPERPSCTLKRKVCKKTCVTKLTAANIKSSPDKISQRERSYVVFSLGYQSDSILRCVRFIPDEAIEPEAGPLNASPDASVAVASADAGGTYPGPASPMQPNVGATREPLRGWTPEEDTKLTSAVEATRKKKYREEYRTDWVAVAALIPGPPKQQCMHRWHGILRSKTDETTPRVGKWTKEEDSTLEDAAEKHNGTNWAAISARVPGRTKQQCAKRWYDTLRPKSDGTTTRVGKWTKEVDSTLKDAVEKHNGANWADVSALAPSRTDWAAISELVLGRTNKQCRARWLKCSRHHQ
jgi:hypothetical protein